MQQKKTTETKGKKTNNEKNHNICLIGKSIFVSLMCFELYIDVLDVSIRFSVIFYLYKHVSSSFFFEFSFS